MPRDPDAEDARCDAARAAFVSATADSLGIRENALERILAEYDALPRRPYRDDR